jgi:hypothetical protein
VVVTTGVQQDNWITRRRRQIRNYAEFRVNDVHKRSKCVGD